MSVRTVLLFLTITGFGVAQSKVDLTAGWTYERAAQTSGYANMNGWYGPLTYNSFPHAGLTFEHESYWGNFQGNSLNQHVWLGGFTLKPGSSERKVSIFVQPLAGDTRNSSVGLIQHSFTFQLAAGADIKATNSVSLEITPAEYVLNYQHGTIQNSYAAAIGLQFSFGH